MSGPLDEPLEVPFGPADDAIEVKPGRTATVGRMGVLRVLPTKGRRTVGPWCFVDLARPDDLADPPPLEIGPHPHIGLATVTWLFNGSAVHSDSLGTEQLIRPGELNLMTSGRGIAHAEQGAEGARGVGEGDVIAAQMWLALPDDTRDGSSRFEHHEELPSLAVVSGEARVFIGSLTTVSSPARIDHPAVGADVAFANETRLAVFPHHEHGIVPIDHPVKVEDSIVEVGSIALVPPGFDELRIEELTGRARFLLLGGAPLGVEIKMWWNFVARSFDELTDAWRAWQDHDDDRFGPVVSPLDRIDAPKPPWLP